MGPQHPKALRKWGPWRSQIPACLEAVSVSVDSAVCVHQAHTLQQHSVRGIQDTLCPQQEVFSASNDAGWASATFAGLLVTSSTQEPLRVTDSNDKEEEGSCDTVLIKQEPR